MERTDAGSVTKAMMLMDPPHDEYLDGPTGEPPRLSWWAPLSL